MGTKDDIIADLRQLVERQAKQIDVLTNEVDRLTKQVKVLRTEVTDLKIQLAKAQKDSTTSSMAPSSDITGAGQKKNQGNQVVLGSAKQVVSQDANARYARTFR